MFSKIFSLITIALVLSGTTLAAPASTMLTARKDNASPDVKVCTGSTQNGCVSIPIDSDECTNFVNGLSFLNKEVSTAVIPGGIVCTFFEDFGCQSEPGDHDAVVLTEGTWDFREVPGPDETVDFNDLASSFSCSPL